MKRNKIPNRRNKKYIPNAFNDSPKEVVPPTPLVKKVLKVTLIAIASILLIAAIILRVRHFLIKHW
ncbi:hypothetical protein [Pedobacter sp. BAL39]|uniref:hypothetical protein n=1 Tax=Pedobacter sp. BAL39 TaxID=391596 RepID=UPI0012FC2406|nr:hypothetical protein [Pedobacter sp. BAL39]